MHRTPVWEFQLLDHDDTPLGRLDGVTGGSGEVVAQAPLGGSASLSLDSVTVIDWMRHRVQAFYVNGDTRWPMGTWLFTSPVETHTEFGVEWSVDLLTKMSVVDEDAVDGRYSLPAGTPIIPAVVALLASTGETRMAVTESGKTLASDYTADPGTSKLTIINELLQAAGYWSLWCDPSGLFRIEPYVEPGSRAVAHHFQYGEDSLYLPGWEREQDTTKVPNKVVLTSDGDSEEEGLTGVATNTDPDSPYSFENRGDRWITYTDTVEAADQTVIDQLAQRKLADLMDPVARFRVDHAVFPLLQNDLVHFTPEDGVTRRATVQRMSFDFTMDTDIRAEWREVNG